MSQTQDAPAADDTEVTIMIAADTINVSELVDEVEEIIEDSQTLDEDAQLLNDLNEIADLEAVVSEAATALLSSSTHGSKRNMTQRSPHASPSKAIISDEYDDADSVRVDSGPTTESSQTLSLSSGAKKARQENKEDKKAKMQLIRDNFPAFGLSSRKVDLMAELDHASIHLLAGLIPMFHQSVADISLDILSEIADLEIKDRLAYLQQYQLHLFEKMNVPQAQTSPTQASTLPVNHVQATHETNGTSVPLGTNGTTALPHDDHESQIDTESMTDRSWASEVEDEHAGSDVGYLPEAEGVGEGPYADLVHSITDGSHVQGEMSASGFTGKGKTHTEIAQYGNFNEELWSRPGNITTEEIAKRLKYIEDHAHDPSSILTGALAIHEVPWTGSLPCGMQPLLIAKGATKGGCKKCLRWGMCATDTCWDMHYSRGRVGCPEKSKGSGHGSVWWVWFDNVLEDVEKTCPGAIPQLAWNWRDHILHALAHRRWKEKCESHLRLGLDDPITLAKAAFKTANAQRLREANARATERVNQLPTAGPTSGPTPSNSPAQPARPDANTTSQGQWNQPNPHVGNRGGRDEQRSNHSSNRTRSNPPPRPNHGAQPQEQRESRDRRNRPRGNGKGNGHSQSAPHRPRPRAHHQTTLDGMPQPGPSRRERENQGGRVRRTAGRPHNYERH